MVEPKPSLANIWSPKSTAIIHRDRGINYLAEILFELELREYDDDESYICEDCGKQLTGKDY